MPGTPAKEEPLVVPCTFCTEPTPFIREPEGQGQGELLRGVCRAFQVQVPAPALTPEGPSSVPCCASCERQASRVVSLQAELERVKAELALTSVQLRDRVLSSGQGEGSGVEFAVAFIKHDGNPEVKAALTVGRAVRDLIAAGPQPSVSGTTVELPKVIYLTAVAGGEGGETYVVSGTSEEHVPVMQVQVPNFFGEGEGQGHDPDQEGFPQVTEEVTVATEGEENWQEGSEDSETHHSQQEKRQRSGKKKHSLSTTTKKAGSARSSNPVRINSDLPFKCGHCAWSFDTARRLRIHTATHTGEALYKCEECREEFQTSSGIRKHNLERHGDQHPFPCSKCDKRFMLLSGLKLHMGSHVESLNCEICGDGKVFKTRHSWRRHVRSHEESSMTFKCVYCGKDFNRKEDMVGHMIRVHRGEEGEKECNFCGRAFQGAVELITHVYAHASMREVKCESCSVKFSTRDDLRIHNSDAHGISFQKFPCDQCGAVLLSQKGFSVHQKLHQPVSQATLRASLTSRTYTCLTCHADFTSRVDLNRHKNLDHKDRHNFRCTKCSLVMDDEEMLQEHMENHPPDGEFLCLFCDKKFGNAASLQRHHAVIHREGAREYPCSEPDCDYKSKRKDDLRKHERIMHQNVERNSDGTKKASGSSSVKEGVACDLCNKKFITSNALEQHKEFFHTDNDQDAVAVKKERTTSYECEHCGKSCAKRKDLLQHLKTHQGEEEEGHEVIVKKGEEETTATDFICHTCEMRFRTKANLQRHEDSTHSNKGRPWTCTVCEKGFKRKDDAMKHVKGQHKGVAYLTAVEFRKNEKTNETEEALMEEEEDGRTQRTGEDGVQVVDEEEVQDIRRTRKRRKVDEEAILPNDPTTEDDEVSVVEQAPAVEEKRMRTRGMGGMPKLVHLK